MIYVQRVVALLVCVCVVTLGLRPLAASAGKQAVRAAEPAPAPNDNEYFLRDAIPAVSFASEPPDTTDEEDDFFLPEQKDTSKLVREIAAWLIAASMVAFFIIKVFIEEDPEESDGDGGGKDYPDPE